MANAAMGTCVGTVKQLRVEPIDSVDCVLHELRTPIAAILCAGENIRDGLLDDKDSLHEEGTIIITQAMRLMRAVEVIDNAVNGALILLQQGELILEREIQPGLPALRDDLSLLSQCLHNLTRMP